MFSTPRTYSSNEASPIRTIPPIPTPMETSTPLKPAPVELEALAALALALVAAEAEVMLVDASLADEGVALESADAEVDEA